MHLRVFLLGLPLIEVATGVDAKDQPAGSAGAEAVTERRPSPDATWADGPGIPDDEARVGFRPRT